MSEPPKNRAGDPPKDRAAEMHGSRIKTMQVTWPSGPQITQIPMITQISAGKLQVIAYKYEKNGSKSLWIRRALEIAQLERCETELIIFMTTHAD